jgi:hypothetical protein
LKGIRDGVGKLVRLTEQRPFLREHELPLAVVWADQLVDIAADVEDMLHDARFLIVGLLDQEGIVLNAFGGRLGPFLREERKCSTGRYHRRGKDPESFHGGLFLLEAL